MCTLEVGILNKWLGAATICVNSDRQLLMVLQGKPEEEKRWSVPSGGKENAETLEECCIREVFEETGYQCRVVNKINNKKGAVGLLGYEVTYFGWRLLMENQQSKTPMDLSMKLLGKVLNK